MVVRPDAQSVATFFAADEPLRAGSCVALGAAVARHARALRLGPGTRAHLVDGGGHRATATLTRVSHEVVQLQVDSVEEIAPQQPIHLLVPVADRERTLWLAEKSAELGAASWRPVIWRRSRSVTPRGEGAGFSRRVRARMISALEQSSGAWLPDIHPEATLDRAIAALPEGSRIVLHPDGAPILDVSVRPPVALATGPEGGLEEQELTALHRAGFVRVSLGGGILRFETAAIAALAIVRNVLIQGGPTDDQ